MRKVDPFLTREKLVQFFFDLHRVFRCDDTQSAANPRDVGVDHHAACDAKGIAQNDVRRLASHARQRHQLVQRAGDLPIVLFHKCLTTGLDVFCLVAKEAGAADELLEGRKAHGRQIFCSGILGKELLGHLIDPLIGALRRKDCRHKQLQGRIETKRAVDNGIFGRQGPRHAGCVAFRFTFRFSRADDHGDGESSQRMRICGSLISVRCLVPGESCPAVRRAERKIIFLPAPCGPILA